MAELFVCILFLVIGIILVIFYRKKFISNADDLVLYSDEKIIYTEFPVKCWLKQWKTNKTYMPGSKVEITNYRIIISQKYLFSQKFLLNYVINYKIKKSEEFNRTGNLRFKNFMDVSISDIMYESKKGVDHVLISVPKNNILSMSDNTIISFSTGNVAKIKVITGS